MIRVMLALFCCSALPLASQSARETQTSAADQLAARISSLLPRRSTVSLELQSLTAVPPAEWLSFRSQLQDALRQLGVATATTQPDSRVHVTLSEDSHGLLLVAEVFSGENRQVAMLPWNPPAAAPQVSSIRIINTALLSQSEPILDILMVDSGMLILDSHQVADYQAMEGKWRLVAAAVLSLPRPMPRDPRGRLEKTADGFRAYLPVGTCDGTWQPGLKVQCANGNAQWQSAPVHWLADRNVLEPESTGFEGWGSDSASVADPCGSGTVVLASSPNNEHDSVRAYKVANGEASALSGVLALPGPVTALWPADSERDATLVVHNLQTGEYEASRLGLACSQ